MRRLLYITTNIHNSGGVAKVLSLKLNYLVSVLNYEVHVLNNGANYEETFFKFDDRIHFHETGIRKLKLLNFNQYKKIVNTIISTIDPEIIINTDNGLKGSLFVYICKQQVPLIYERHCGKQLVFDTKRQHYKFKLANYFTQRGLKRYARFVLLNKTHQLEWNSTNLTVIPNPIRIDKSSISNTNRERIVLSVGRIAPEKGYVVLLLIWSKVVKKYPDWVLHIYGEGEKSNLKTLALNLGISDSVQMYDAVQNVQEVYQNVSIYVSTSLMEAFGLSIGEAMLNELPVISFKTAGASELIQDGVTGFLVNHGDIDHYVEIICNLIDDPEKRKSVGLEAKDHAKKFSIESIMKQWNDLFMSI